MINIENIKKSKSIKELAQFAIINLDKPSGPTSFDAISIARGILSEIGVNKTSHFGTLDPMVSGVLPMALNRACRLADYFMHRNKTYVGIMRIHQEVSDEKLNEEIKNFIGKIMQLPPIKSRVKREIREREIVSFEILEREGKDALFFTEVQAGTYIRKLCDDIGKKIGGAHMLELRRIKAGIFEEQDSVTLYELQNAVEEYKKGNEEKLRKILIPAEIAAKLLPEVQVNKSAVKRLYTGSPVFNEMLKEEKDRSKFKKEEKVSIFCGEVFIETARVTGEKGIFARPEFVLQPIK